MNKYYQKYQEECIKMEKIEAKYEFKITSAKKLRGALAVEMLRSELNSFFCKNKLKIKVSAANSYIYGSKYEYDLILVKSEAEGTCNIVYYPEDVIAVIESKAGGLFNLQSETDNIAMAVNRAWELNNNIKFGYITLSENIPKNNINSKGNPTVNHWELTKKLLSQKVKAESSIYAVTLHQGKTIVNEGTDYEFEEFIQSII